MKYILNRSLICLLCFLMALALCQPIIGQESEPVRKKEKARLSLNFFNSENNSPTLEALLRTKVQGYYQGIINAPIDFYEYEVSEENMLGSAVTDSEGKASIQFLQTETGMVAYFAVFKGDEKFRGTERDIEIKKAVLEMKTEMIDSIAAIEVLVSTFDSSGQVIPAVEVPLSINVKRLYGLLPVAEESETDEDGMVEIELPMDLPGDRQGNLTIVAKVADHDEYGNLEISKIAAYGIPLIQNDNTIKEIWLASPSSNTSKVLMMIVSTLLLGILGVVFYIVFELRSIKKLGQNH